MQVEDAQARLMFHVKQLIDVLRRAIKTG